MMVKRLVKVMTERTIKTYVEMWDASYFFLQKGIEDRAGSYYQFIASIVFTAFTLEAYLNHIGKELFPGILWSTIEERLSLKAKLDVIAERLNITINYGERPWQVIGSLFPIRNAIAHGKTSIISTKQSVSLENYNPGMPEFIKTDWEEYCTRENVEKVREDVEKIVFTLYNAGHFENDYPFIHGIQVGTASVIDS